MAKYTPSKSYEKWSNGYYGDYGNSKYGNSSFWLDDDFGKSFTEGGGVDTIKMMSYQRAIGNFVRILTKRTDIKVVYSTKNRSYTDGDTVVISSKIDKGDFDTTVGLALHEASHCLLTNFKAMPTYLNNHKEIPYADWQYFKGLVNIIEDRRIDAYVIKNAPGYYGYYMSMYDTYFNSKEIDKALGSNIWCEESREHYENHICNFANPKRNLNALKNLRKIWDVIDLKNISRLKSTDEVLEVAHKVYNLVLEAEVIANGKGQNQSRQDQDAPKEMTEKEIEQMLNDIENNPSSGGVEEGDDNDTNGTLPAPGMFEGDEEADDQDGGGMDTDANSKASKAMTANLSDVQKARLEKALKKQKEFTDGSIKKKDMKQTEADKISELADQDVQLVEVSPTGDGTNKVDVIVLRGMSDAICKSELVGCQYIDIAGRRSESKHSNAIAVEEGWALGGVLGRKLKTRDEERSLKTTRLPSGRIDRRLISELGFGNDKVFAQTLIKTVKPSMIHISLDASGSMGGSKWEAALKTATALARACSMIENLRCVIDTRGNCGGRNSHSRALVWVVYDSKFDPISVVRTKFQNLWCGGATPEGLCYDAIMKTIIGNSKGSDSFFVNISDGDPAFTNYYGTTAEKHTAKQIKKMQADNIKTISYFASGYSKQDAMATSAFKAFTRMYGKDAQCIDLNDFNQLSKTLNAMFERDVTNE